MPGIAFRVVVTDAAVGKLRSHDKLRVIGSKKGVHMLESSGVLNISPKYPKHGSWLQLLTLIPTRIYMSLTRLQAGTLTMHV